MRIGQEYKSKIGRKPIKKVKGKSKTFQQMVHSKKENLHDEELEQMIDDITKQGEKIARFRSFRDLAAFKRMIKEFLEKTIGNGLTLTKTRGFNAENYSETLSTVHEIDEKLIELTDDLLDQEKKTVDILNLIGEIRGLLVNITM